MKPAPDAARSFLGNYSVVNPMVLWLLREAPHLLTEDASRFHRGARAPACPNPFCGEAMVFRPNAWVCYQHREPIRQKIEVEYERAPKVDVLSRAGNGKMLDWQFDELKGRYVMVEVQL